MTNTQIEVLATMRRRNLGAIVVARHGYVFPVHIRQSEEVATGALKTLQSGTPQSETMTDETRFSGLVVNNTGSDIDGIFEDAIRNANGAALPEEIADLFSVRVVTIDGERRLIVDMT